MVYVPIHLYFCVFLQYSVSLRQYRPLSISEDFITHFGEIDIGFLKGCHILLPFLKEGKLLFFYRQANRCGGSFFDDHLREAPEGSVKWSPFVGQVFKAGNDTTKISFFILQPKVGSFRSVTRHLIRAHCQIFRCSHANRSC